MSAKETDARTQYNILTQMLFKNPLEGVIPDFTLNATTSEAWLARWKDYLRRKGVQFYIGALERLKKTAGGFVPVVKGLVAESDNSKFVPRTKIDAKFFNDSRFFVMALPFDRVSDIIWDAYSQVSTASSTDIDKFTGPFHQLMEFDKYTGRRTEDGSLTERSRNVKTGRPLNIKDPMRDISGIQYFLLNNYRLGKGHVYYSDSPWALTSISQIAFWRERVKPVGKYIGHASFDIGNWYASYTPKDWDYASISTAWNSSRQELAEYTWKQGLEAVDKLQAKFLVTPKYYHLDQGIKFSEEEEKDNRRYIIAAFRANALLNLTDLNKTKDIEGEYELILYGDGPSKRATGRNKSDLLTNINISSVAFATDAGENLIMISPLIEKRQAIIKITGIGRRSNSFIVRLQGENHQFDAREKDSPETIARKLGEAIEQDRRYHVEVKGELIIISSTACRTGIMGICLLRRYSTLITG
jgi:hypothetical protein